MTFDTEWPASPLLREKQRTDIAADRLEWCLRYIAEEARRGGFSETADALEALTPVRRKHELSLRPA